jgi:hypothetical protein
MPFSEKLQIDMMSYPRILLSEWIRGDFSFLEHSRASDYIRRVLPAKAQERPGRRFFGEAYIASRTEMKDGWYSSYKWLTSERWLSGHGLKSTDKKLFQKVLMDHIGGNVLANLQHRAIRLFQHEKRRLLGRKPVVPDLWLIAPDGTLTFIESKLEGDRVSPSQIAGLALIKKYVQEVKPTSVSIIKLQSDTRPQGKNDDTSLRDMFSMFYKLA